MPRVQPLQSEACHNSALIKSVPSQHKLFPPAHPVSRCEATSAEHKHWCAERQQSHPQTAGAPTAARRPRQEQPAGRHSCWPLQLPTALCSASPPPTSDLPTRHCCQARTPDSALLGGGGRERPATAANWSIPNCRPRRGGVNLGVSPRRWAGTFCVCLKNPLTLNLRRN